MCGSYSALNDYLRCQVRMGSLTLHISNIEFLLIFSYEYQGGNRCDSVFRKKLVNSKYFDARMVILSPFISDMFVRN